MSSALKRTSDQAPKSRQTYRGVSLQASGVGGRFSLAQIKKAVDAAVTKNADVLSRKK